MNLGNPIDLSRYQYLFSEDQATCIVGCLNEYNISSRFAHKVFWAMRKNDDSIFIKDIEFAIQDMSYRQCF